MEQSAPKDNSMMLTLVAIGGFALLSIGALAVGVGVYFYSANEAGPAGPSVTTGSVSFDGKKANLGASLAGAANAGGHYEPSSAYIEKGADSDVTQLGFEKEEQDAPSRPLSEYDIQNTIAENQNDLITCYAEGLEDNPDLTGRVDFHFRIAGDGHVAMIKVTESGLRDKATEDCFVRVARAWEFPASNSPMLTKFDTDFMFAY